MLKPDVAQKQVEKWRLEDGEEKLIAAIAKQPAKLRKIAFGLLNCDDHGEEFKYDRWGERALDRPGTADQHPRDE